MLARAFLLDLDFYAEHFDRLLASLFACGIALLVATSFTGQGADLIVGDARDYFEYARALMIDGHLPTAHIKYPCGVALVGMVGYAPVVLLGKVLISLGVLAPGTRWASGYALPQQIAYCIPFLILSFVAFRANVAMLVRLGFASRIVKPMVLFWIVATNVGFYVFKEPGQSESGTYATLSLYYWALVRWFYRSLTERGIEQAAVAPREWVRRALITGLFLGLAGTIRQQNILHSVALPLLLVTQARALFGPDRAARLAGAIRVLTVAALASAALFILPWAAWSAADGSLAFFSYGDEHFNFTSPHPLDALFNVSYHGLFVWHPAFALAAIGLVIFARRYRDLAAAWIVPLLLQFYLISSWYWLAFGASIGHRGFFTIFPLLLAGWIAFGDYVERNGRSRALLAGLIVLALANAAVTVLLSIGKVSALGLPPGTT